MTLTKLTSSLGGFDYVNLEHVVSVRETADCYVVNLLDGMVCRISLLDSTISTLVSAA